MSMSKLKAFALFLCFVYSLALVMGYPEARLPFSNSIKITEEEPEESKEEMEFYWKTGLFKKSYLQAQALYLFEEELLEGDTKPKEIFRRLDRSLIQNIFFLCLSIFYLFLLGLCLLNFGARDLFLNKLSTFLLLSSAIFLSTDLFLLYRKGLLESIAGNFFISVMASTKIIVLFFSLAALLYQCISLKLKVEQGSKEKKAKPMEARTQNLYLFPVKGKTLFPLAFHFLLICIGALLLSNVFLFPLYALQLSFPDFFALFLFLLLISLSAYYIYAYWHRLSIYRSETKLAIVLAFLAYRLLSNSLFLLSIFFVIVALALSIVFISVYNIDILYAL